MYREEAAQRHHVCKAEANSIRIGCVCFAGTNIVLRFAYGSEGVFAMFFVTIGASEFIVCGIIGMLLLFALNPVRNVIFKGVE